MQRMYALVSFHRSIVYFNGRLYSFNAMWSRADNWSPRSSSVWSAVYLCSVRSDPCLRSSIVNNSLEIGVRSGVLYPFDRSISLFFFFLSLFAFGWTICYKCLMRTFCLDSLLWPDNSPPLGTVGSGRVGSDFD